MVSMVIFTNTRVYRPTKNFWITYIHEMIHAAIARFFGQRSIVVMLVVDDEWRIDATTACFYFTSASISGSIAAIIQYMYELAAGFLRRDIRCLKNFRATVRRHFKPRWYTKDIKSVLIGIREWLKYTKYERMKQLPSDDTHKLDLLYMSSTLDIYEPLQVAFSKQLQKGKTYEREHT